MKNLRFLSVAILFLFFCSFSKDKIKKEDFDISRKFSVAELQEDFRVMRRDIEKRQPNLYLYSTRERVDFVFDSLYKGIDRPMNFGEFFFHISPILSVIKDGHNLIGLSEERGKYNDKFSLYLPLHIVYVDGKFYSDMNCSKDSSIYDGAEILAIDGKPAKQIHDEISIRMVRDGYNQTLPDWIMETFFRGYFSIMKNHPANYSIDFLGRDGQKKTALIEAELIDTLASVRNRKYKEKFAFLNRRKGLELKFDSESKTAILSIESFDPDLLKKKYHQHFKKIMDRFFMRIDSAKSENLIVDVRNNGGGNPAFSRYLLQYIMKEKFVYAENAIRTRRFNADKRRLKKLYMPGFGVGEFDPFKKAFQGNVYVLINGGSFSASGEFASVLARYKRAVFIGEETGGNNVICGGQMFKHKVTLPNTKIVCMTGTEATAIRDLKENTGHGTMPDYFVHASIRDMLVNKDTEMEFTLELIRKKN